MKLAIITASLGLLASLTPSALATSSYEDKRVSTAASACTVVSGTATFNSFGRVTNESTTSLLQVDCPLGFTTTPMEDVLAFARVRTNGSILYCNFYMDETHSGAFNSVSTSSSAIASMQYLQGTLTSYSIIHVGVLHAFCSIPAKNANGAAAIYSFVADGE